MVDKKRAWAIAENLLFGCIMVLAGSWIWETGWDSKHDMPVYNWAGLLLAGAGLPFILYGIYLLLKSLKTRGQEPVEFICPDCESVYFFLRIEEHLCPYDGAVLEPLEGYYNRHPERRDEPIRENLE